MAATPEASPKLSLKASPGSASFSHDATLAPLAVAPRAFLAARPEYDGLATGAVVFDDKGRVLLVQRAETDSMPLRWEVPGGAVDADDDKTVLHGLARELREETGLTALHIGPSVGVDDKDKDKDMDDGIGQPAVFFTRGRMRVAKYSCIVCVANGERVRLDPAEHCAFCWASEAEVRAGRLSANGPQGGLEIPITTRSQARVVLEAFRVRAAMSAPSAPDG